jgi:hypothetical protein
MPSPVRESSGWPEIRGATLWPPAAEREFRERVLRADALATAAFFTIASVAAIWAVLRTRRPGAHGR